MKEKMGRTVTSVARDKREKRYGAVFSVIVIFFCLFLQVNCVSDSTGKRKDPCPKLEVLTDSGCRPCSLCNPDQPGFDPLSVRDGCKEKHPDIIQHGDKLWCDHRKGPFPECPTLPEAIVRRCTDKCKDLNRNFAPGCKCQVGCPGDPGSIVECTRDLWWSDNTSITVQCHRPSTTTAAMKRPVTESGVFLKPPYHPQKEATPWYLVLLGVFGGLVIACAAGVMFYCWYKRRKESDISSSESSSVDSSEKSYKTEDALLGSVEVEKDMKTVGGRKAASGAVGQTACRHPCDQNSGTSIATEAEVYTHGGDQTPERETLLGRGTGDHVEGKTPSQQALQALLRDRRALYRLTQLLDQRDQFGKVTWHTVANEFVGWDVGTIRHKEYMLLPSADCSPGDSFTYQVLMDAHKAGKGLLELLHHLEHRQHLRHPEVEWFLRDFWTTWKQENAAGNGAAC